MIDKIKLYIRRFTLRRIREFTGTSLEDAVKRAQFDVSKMEEGKGEIINSMTLLLEYMDSIGISPGVFGKILQNVKADGKYSTLKANLAIAKAIEEGAKEEGS